MHNPHTSVIGNTLWVLATSQMVAHLPWWAIAARLRQTKIVENTATARLRSAGCTCPDPLIGIRPDGRLRCRLCNREETPSCPSPSLHYSESDDSLNTKTLTLADCGYCEGKVVVRL